MSRRKVFVRVATCTASAVLTACGATSSSSSPTPSVSQSSVRPASTAHIHIVQPADGAVVPAGTLHIAVAITGGQIVPITSTHLTPDTGHVHLYVDNSLMSMNYGTQQDIPVQPGTFTIKAEFVAVDHAPFNPRVTDQVTVTVK